MMSFLNFPVHVATATSHLVIAIMALAATSVHIISGDFAHGVHRTIALVIGVVPGRTSGRLALQQDPWWRDHPGPGGAAVDRRSADLPYGVPTPVPRRRHGEVATRAGPANAIPTA